MIPGYDHSAELGPEFASLIGPGGTLLPADLQKYINADHGLAPDQRVHLLKMLNSPDMAGHLFAGVAGAAVALAIARWKKMSATSQVLMSLAGFGLGNIILNKLEGHPKHTSWDSDTGTVTVL
jgi:hypothetical protein